MSAKLISARSDFSSTLADSSGTLSERRPTIEPDSITQPRIERFFERLAVCPKHFHSDLLTIERRQLNHASTFAPQATIRELILTGQDSASQKVPQG
jgi:hypothetical protein